MKYFFLMVCVLSTYLVKAQKDSASVEVFKDPRIDILIEKQAELNNSSTKNNANRHSARGYRLLVITTSKRDDAIKAKTTIYNNFPELKPYMWHQAPFYKVKAGNFTERSDAAAYQKKINVYFPNGVFIMSDIVEIKPVKNKEED